MIQLIGIVAGVAQLVEQLIRNQQVAGSSPATSSMRKEYLHSRYSFFNSIRRIGMKSPHEVRCMASVAQRRYGITRLRAIARAA